MDILYYIILLFSGFFLFYSISIQLYFLIKNGLPNDKSQYSHIYKTVIKQMTERISPWSPLSVNTSTYMYVFIIMLLLLDFNTKYIFIYYIILNNVIPLMVKILETQKGEKDEG
jgi:hypothetical protein